MVNSYILNNRKTGTSIPIIPLNSISKSAHKKLQKVTTKQSIEIY